LEERIKLVNRGIPVLSFLIYFILISWHT
jgi:hypothetical protein